MADTEISLPVGSAPGIDPHGQAALLLVESLIHTLVETEVMTAVDAMDTVTTAAEVKVEFAEAIHESRARLTVSLDLLTRIRASIAQDVN